MNVVDRVVEVYRDPVGGACRRSEVLRSGDELVVDAFPGVRVRVAALFRSWIPSGAPTRDL